MTMAKAGSEVKTILKLLLKLTNERITKEIDKSIDEENKASEYTKKRDDYQFYKGRVDGLRYAMECINKTVSEIEL
jgi:hypothetical protein